MWELLGSGAFGQVGGDSEGLVVATLSMRNALLLWYVRRHQTHPDEVLTQLNDLPPNMVGAKSDQRCKAKRG